MPTPIPIPNPHPCGQCAFYSQSVWEPVGVSSVAALTHRFTRTQVPVGQTLWKQGSENAGVVCVSKGLIALRSLHPDGSSTLLGLAYPGEVIGIRSFLTGRDHQTEAKALLPSRVCVVSNNRATRIAQNNPGVMSRLAIRCIDEIDRTHERIIAAATLSNKEHLATLLQRLMDVHGERDGAYYRMRLPLSRSDLADLIGVQPETLSRIVGRLEKDGRFKITGRKVVTPVAPAPGKKYGSLPV
jgi:CRP/FNR family transcriptional regulator